MHINSIFTKKLKAIIVDFIVILYIIHAQLNFIRKYMFDRFTKLFYITSSVLVAYAVIFCSITFCSQAALKDGQKFDDWVVRCNNKFQSKHKCFVQQILSQTQKPEKGKKEAKPISQNILVTNFGYFKEDNTLTIVQSFPFG